MRTFRISILLAVCVAVAVLIVGRAGAQYRGSAYGQPASPQSTAPQPYPHPQLEYALLFETGDGIVCNFITPQRMIDASSIPDLAHKLGCNATEIGVLNAIGAQGWSLVCKDHDSLGTNWYFDRVK
jgi:hypothetical protein